MKRFLFFQLGIFYSGVVDDFQTPDKSLLDCVDVFKAERRVIEESVGNLAIDNAVYEIAESLVGVFRETS